MAEVVVRNLEPHVLSYLEETAEERAVSLEDEIHRILREAAEPPVARLTPEIQRIQAMFQGRIQSDSAELIREDRDR